MLSVPFSKDAALRKRGSVRQSNALVKSKRPLNLMQTQLFYIFLETIRTTDEKFDIIEISVPVLKELLRGSYGSFYDDLRSAAQALAGSTFSLLRPSGSWVFIPVFDRIEYLKSEEENEKGYTNRRPYDVVRCRLHDDLSPHLLRLDSNFGVQDLIYVLTIPRVRAQRLYEILLHDSWRGQRPEVTFDTDLLQDYLGIEKKYGRWQDLKRLIKRHQDDIHKFTDLRFSFEGVRTGRSITQATFNVKFEKGAAVQRRLDAPADPEAEIEKVQVSNELLRLGYALDPYQAFEKYGLSVVKAAIKRAKAAHKASLGTKSEIGNLPGLVHSLLQNKVADDVLPPEADKPTFDTLKRKSDDLRQAFYNEQQAVIEQHIQALSDKKRAELDSYVREKLNPFERALVADEVNGEVAFRAIRNRHALEGFIILPEQLQDTRRYYKDKDFGFDRDANQRIYDLLAD